VQTSPGNPLIDNGRAIENNPNPRRRANHPTGSVIGNSANGRSRP
jgi:hypothetical protein